MNEKIKDFLEQAYTYSFQENRGQFVLNDFAEKFSELIVRECATLVDTSDSSKPYTTFGEQLKAHFGVE